MEKCSGFQIESSHNFWNIIPVKFVLLCQLRWKHSVTPLSLQVCDMLTSFSRLFVITYNNGNIGTTKSQHVTVICHWIWTVWIAWNISQPMKTVIWKYFSLPTFFIKWKGLWVSNGGCTDRTRWRLLGQNFVHVGAIRQVPSIPRSTGPQRAFQEKKRLDIFSKSARWVITCWNSR